MKARNINGKNAGDMDDIIGHIGRAFEISFPDLAAKKEVYIDEFYVIISGEYVGNAIDQIVRDSRIKKYGNRLHFFDGNKVKELSRYDLALYKEKIDGLLLELMSNRGKLQEILNNLNVYKEKNESPLYLLKLHNMEIYLEGISEQNSGIIPEMYYLVNTLNNINAILGRFRLGLSLPGDQDEYIKKVFPDAIAKISRLIDELTEI